MRAYKDAHALFMEVLWNDPGSKSLSSAACADKAAAIATDALNFDTAGVVYSRAGLHQRAVPFYRRAVAAMPGKGNSHYNLRTVLQFVGDLKEAREAYRETVRLNPDDARSLTAAMQITWQSPKENNCITLAAMFARFAGDPDAALHFGHALARTLAISH